jgi:hypothetical protein
MKIATYNSHDLARVIFVRFRIAPREVGKILGQHELLSHHNERAFFALGLGPEVLGTKDQAKLKGHIEAWKIVDVELDAREIVDRVAALANQLCKLREPDLGAVAVLQRAASHVPASHNREHQRSEARGELLVEGAVDEDVPVSFTQGLWDGSGNMREGLCGRR